jgi:24-hydroxycholesterol 7alpha-hydroxylase
MDLMSFVRQTMFDSVVRQLFGADNVPETETGMRELERKFVKFDEDFEYGTQLPEFLIRDWSECKYWLLSFFKKMVEKLRDGRSRGGNDQLMIEKLMEMVDPTSAHNYALLFLWASQANAIPVVFWCLGHILSSPDLYRELQNDVINIDFLSLNAESFAEAFRLTMSVRRCVLETMRLHAPGMITRKVVSTHKIGGYDVPAGHYLMLSPYWAHRDVETFPEPETFNPDRWLKCDLEKNQFLDGFVGFGGGRYQCPGRWLAVAEMHLCVAMTLQLFDMKLLDPLPDVSQLHLIGVQQPNKSCRISFSVRKSLH